MNSVEVTNSVSIELLDDIYKAQEVLGEPASPVLPTEIYFDDVLSQRYEANVWIASEIHQPVGSYKIRGAYNFIHNLSEADRARGVVTASAGNHAQGIALGSNQTGVHAEIFMPVCTPVQKVGQVTAHGEGNVTINLVGDSFDETQQIAMRFCEQKGAVFASPFNDRKVIAGQGTWGLEVTDSIDNLDFVFCPVGGMGLLAGISTAIKSINPDSKIIGVEPEGATSLRHAYRFARPYPLPRLDTFVDGAAVKKVGEIPFKLAAHLVSGLVSIGKLDVRQATTELWQRSEPLKAELAGALSVAALKQYSSSIRGKDIVCLVTGGNLSQARFSKEVKM